jgi:hypothetical protein
MIETLPTATARSDLSFSAVALAAFRQEIVGQSRIIWGEHCLECACPHCYRACGFCTPRADLHCRRFEAGTPIADATGAFRLNRVRFRRQGKLEHRGATAVRPLARVARAHAKDMRIASALGALKRSHPFADADVAALAGEVAIEAV